jgi:cytoskeletal protein CcmA (bactofilin family)
VNPPRPRASILAVKAGKAFLVASAVALAAALPPVPALAATVRTGGDTGVPANETVEGNAYLVSGRSAVAGAVTGDLVIAAGEAAVSGAVGGDLTILGYRADVSGDIAGDLRVAGGFVVVSGKVGGDLVVAGGRVAILPGATVAGALVAAGGELATEATVEGGLDVVAGSASIGGRQGGGTVTAPSVTFLSSASGGGISYYAQRQATIQSGASLASLSYNQIPPISEIGPVRRGALSFFALWNFFSFASTVVLGLALAYGARVFAQEAAQVATRGIGAFAWSAAAGLGTFLLLPLVSLLAIASIFALPLGILGLLVTAALLVLASALGALAVGFAVERALRRGAEVTVSYRAVGLGAVVVALIGFVPGGSAVKLVVALAGVGAAARVAARRLRGEGWSVERVLGRWGGAK